MLLEAEFWVAIAFAMFLAVLWYTGVHRKVLDALDQRSAQIKRELDDVRDLKQEAEIVLRDACRKQREFEDDIERIMDGTRAQARYLMVEARAAGEEFARRQSKLAATKIAQAELQAVADIRNAAIEAAIFAAEEVLKRSVNGKAADRVFIHGIEAVRAKLASRS